tara:strand:+ start:364 stop:1065 length:702 start_codon:yes stop_codon:yes gene_type:complete
MTTKIPAELSSTPSIVDNGDATAITIDSSENVTIGAVARVNSYISLNNNGYIRGDASGELKFQGGSTATTFYDSSNSAERVRIQEAGGISFNGDTAAANALDDYEEGTWTATLSSSGGSFAASATSFTGGQYTKIGNLVTAHIYTGSFDITNAGSGYAKVSGLPYTSRSGSYDYGGVIFYHTNCFANPSPTGYVAGGADFTIASRGDQSAVGAVSWTTGTTLYLMLQVQYQAA